MTACVLDRANIGGFGVVCLQASSGNNVVGACEESSAGIYIYILNRGQEPLFSARVIFKSNQKNFIRIQIIHTV